MPPHNRKIRANASIRTTNHRREFAAILTGTTALLLVLALFSYSPETPGGNFIGPLGHGLADAMFRLFGVTAFAVGLGVIALSIGFFRQSGFLAGRGERLGYPLIFVFLPVLLALAAPNATAKGHALGGWLGSWGAGVAAGAAGRVGAIILCSAILLAALVLCADISVITISRTIGATTAKLWTTMVRWARERKEARAKQRTVIPGSGPSLPAASGQDSGPVPPPPRMDPAPPVSASTPALLQKLKVRQEEENTRRSGLAPVAGPGADGSPGGNISSIPALESRTRTPSSAPSDPAPGRLNVNQTSPQPPGGEPASSLPPEAPASGAVNTPEQLRDTLPNSANPAEATRGKSVPAAEPPSAPENREPQRQVPIGPTIVDVQDGKKRVDPLAVEAVRDGTSGVEWRLPPLSLLDYQPPAGDRGIDRQLLLERAQLLVDKLATYGVPGEVKEIRPGPVVTMYEFAPAPGIKLSKIQSLSNDLAMSLAALSVRIVAPIPGKAVCGIEVPNDRRETVFLKEILAADNFKNAGSTLALALGKDIEGDPIVVDLRTMPHLLVAGSTGTGKSVSMNAMIMSILMNATPREVRLILIDPKMVEMGAYRDIPHLLLPVVSDMKQAGLALNWAVEEMERRYRLLADCGVANLLEYNRWVEESLADDSWRGVKFTVPRVDAGGEPLPPEDLPSIVVIVDEFADLMMVAPKEVEYCVARLAQKARAAGIHLILATQRPSTDVITGVIKANFPARVSFKVASGYDSKTILDATGAENLLGKGDMLFLSPTVHGLQRVHGALVTGKETKKVCQFLRDQGTPRYDENILRPRPGDKEDSGNEENHDEKYDEAVAFVLESRVASISAVQRRLRIGYNRAANIIERMEREGLVGPANGSGPREVLAPPPPK
ncbi:MAG: hypothetical protein GMKNLPBB_00636 [Myxococcota bacterium]|nr:hypothetical protein [Myxococcota bacterium]